MFLVRVEFLSVLFLAVFATGCGSESTQKTELSPRPTDRHRTSGDDRPKERDSVAAAVADNTLDWFEERATTSSVKFRSETGRESGAI